MTSHLERSFQETEWLKKRHQRAWARLGLEPVPSPAPRKVPAKEPLITPPGEQFTLSVKFADRLIARSSPQGQLVISPAQPELELAKLIQEHGLRFLPAQTAAPEAIEHLEARAIANTGIQAADLNSILGVDTQDLPRDKVIDIAESLLALPCVVFVSLESMDQPTPPPGGGQDAVVTFTPNPDLVRYQTYRGPDGVKTDWAWEHYPNSRGQGVRVTNLEYRFNENHEDFEGKVQWQIGSNRPSGSTNHGTGSLGVLAAQENGFGMTGTIDQADFHFYGEGSRINGVAQNRHQTIAAAAADSPPGSVLMLEMQTGGPEIKPVDGKSRNVFPDYNLNVWHVVKTATDAGIHVVQAGGNGEGNTNLDLYDPYFARGDSGAVTVGSVRPSDRTPYTFSPSGRGVHVSGWGGGVATLGSGSLL